MFSVLNISALYFLFHIEINPQELYIWCTYVKNQDATGWERKQEKSAAKHTIDL